MSLILDALKKAEKERDSSETAERPAINPIVPDEKKNTDWGAKLKPIIRLIMVMMIFTGIGWLGFPLVEKMLIGPKPKPITSQNPSPSANPMIGTPPSLPSSPANNEAQSLREEALKKFKEGNYAASQETWNKLAVLTPTDPEVYNNLGVVLKKMGKKDEAQTAYRTALGLKPDYPEALNNLGVVLMEKLMNDEARPLFEKSIQLNPQYAEPYFHLALMLEEAKDYAGALEKYQNFLNLAKNLDPSMKSRIEMRMVSLQSY